MTEVKLKERQQELAEQYEEASKYINKTEKELEAAISFRNKVEGGLEVVGGLIQEYFPEEGGAPDVNDRPESESPAMAEDVPAEDAPEVDVEITEETQEG